MLLALLTIVHVAISLGGIVAGLFVLIGLLSGTPHERWTAPFLATTVATSVTGFFFPVSRFLPSHGAGIISLLVLAVAIYARYSRRLAGRWGKVYAVTAITALYLNVFVAVVQSFLKIPALTALAPTQTEPPFKITQAAVLLLFVAFAVIAAFRSRSQPSFAR